MKIKQRFFNLFKEKEPEVYEVQVLDQIIKRYIDLGIETERYTLVKVIKVLNGSSVREGTNLELNENLYGLYNHSRKINEVYVLTNPFKFGWSIAP